MFNNTNHFVRLLNLFPSKFSCSLYQCFPTKPCILSKQRIAIVGRPVYRLQSHHSSLTDSPEVLSTEAATEGTRMPAIQPVSMVRPNKQVQVLPPPTKGTSDTKQYRSLQLSNGMRVLLISDSERHGTASEPADLEENISEDGASDGSDGEGEEGEDHDDEVPHEDDEGDCGGAEDSHEYKAAASLSVSWGSCQDPPELQGLMHFLEHMVFMGSEKYPKENGFSDFVARHGGCDNAFTDIEHTNFHFDVHEGYFVEGLTRFSQFFVSPLMKKTAMERERNAVDSEFTMALPSDGNRQQQLISSLAVEGHPVNSFTWGNAATLSQRSDDEVHATLHQYRKKYYSAQYMTLAVQSRHTLDFLQDLVVGIFSRVTNNGLPPPDYSVLAFPFPPASVNKLLKVEAMKATHVLVATWFLPPMRHEYRRQPLRLLSWLVGHEGNGSLLSYYKDRNWASSLMASSELDDNDHNSFSSQFEVTIEITEEGLKHVQDVLFAMFQYIAMLRVQQPSKKLYQECKMLAQISLDFSSDTNPIDNVENLTSCMILYPPQDYITGASFMFEYDEQFTRHITDQLTPEGVNIILRSKLLDDFTDGDTKTEKWFGTKYKSEEISDEWRALFDSALTNLNPAFDQPLPNPFIPTDFALLPKPSAPPLLPVEVPLPGTPVQGKLFYKPDHKHCLPRAHLRVQFVLQDLPERRSAKFMNIIAVLLQCYEHHIMEAVYDADQAKYQYYIKYSSDGLVLCAAGFSQHIDRFLDLLLNYLDNFVQHFREDHFTTLRNLQIQHLYNQACKPTTIRNQLRLHMLLPQHQLSLNQLQGMQSVTSEDVLDCARVLLCNARVTMLVQGNVTEAAAVAMYGRVQRSVQRSPASEAVYTMQLEGYRELKEGVTVVRVNTTNMADGNSAVVNYYQGGPGTLKTQLLLDFISCAMDEQCFNILRTKEQLGYSCYSQSNESNGVVGLSVNITPQAEKFSVHFVDSRIEAFLATFRGYLQVLSDDAFATLQETISKMKKIPDVSVKEEISRNWAEVVTGELLFGRIQKHLSMIDSVTKEDMLEFYLSLVDPERPGYSKLSVQVVGSADHKSYKPPPMKELQDGGFSCLKFQPKLPSETPPSPCCPSAPVFVQDYLDFIATLPERPLHQIVS